MKKFTVKLWTKIVNGHSSWDMYATLMPDGRPCAWGTKVAMTEYADMLNKNMEKNPHMVIAGSIKSPKKAKSSRENGKLGGRPKNKEQK